MAVTPSRDALVRAGVEGWWFTEHSLERLEQMGLTWRSALAVVKTPQLDYPTNRYFPGKPPKTRRMAVRAELAVVYDPKDHQIVTVLWNGRETR